MLAPNRGLYFAAVSRKSAALAKPIQRTRAKAPDAVDRRQPLSEDEPCFLLADLPALAADRSFSVD